MTQSRGQADTHVAAHHLAKAVDRGIGRLQFVQHAQPMRVQQLTRFGQFDMARGAAHQLGAQVLLQQFQAARYVGAGHAAALGGGGQRARLDHGDEEPHQVEIEIIVNHESTP